MKYPLIYAAVTEDGKLMEALDADGDNDRSATATYLYRAHPGCVVYVYEFGGDGRKVTTKAETVSIADCIEILKLNSTAFCGSNGAIGEAVIRTQAMAIMRVEDALRER
jgi:hypothetical protein